MLVSSSRSGSFDSGSTSSSSPRLVAEAVSHPSSAARRDRSPAPLISLGLPRLGRNMSGTSGPIGGTGQSPQGGWGLREALGAARVLLSFPPDQCKSDPRAQAWVASLESLLDYVHQSLAPPLSPAANHAEATTIPATGAPLPQTFINDPHGKRAVQEGSSGAGTSTNPRRRSRGEMEGRASRLR